MMKYLKHQIWTWLYAVLFSLTAFSTIVFAGGPNYEEPVEETNEAGIEEGEPLSEKTDIITRDLLYDKATNKQFITIQDRDGNIFYLVIDYDAPVNEDEEQYQTYFLDPVDTADLAALAEENEETIVACSCAERCQVGDVNTACEVCANDMAACMGTDPEPEPPEETAVPEKEIVEEPEESRFNLVVLVAILALLSGGAVFACFMFVKNKSKTRGNTDLDDYDYGEDEDDAEGEDGALWESEDVESDSTDGTPRETEETEDDLI